jgi:hypothetical protein
MGMGPDREKLAEHAAASISLDSRLLEKVDAAFSSAAARAAEAFRAADPETNIGESFETALRAVLEAAAADPDLTRLCLLEAPGLGAKALERKDAGLQRFVDLLDRELACRQGGEAPPLISEMVVGGIYEVVQRTVRAGDTAALPELADQLRQLWLPALRGY